MQVLDKRILLSQNQTHSIFREKEVRGSKGWVGVGRGGTWWDGVGRGGTGPRPSPS